MLALVEPHMGRTLLDTPNLGCAMLVGACARAGIGVRLVRGQTRWLTDMFLRDSGELWELIADLDDEGVRRLRIAPYRSHLLVLGAADFGEELRSLYDAMIASRDPRALFDAARIERLGSLATTFMAVYEDYAVHRPERPLAFVLRYVDEILRSAPRYVGFSLQCGFDPLTRAVRRLVKERSDAPIIVGGSMTPFIEVPIAAGGFQREHIDYMVTGEGEETLVQLIRVLEENGPLDKVCNLVFPAPDGTIRQSSRSVCANLNGLATPDFDQFDLSLLASPDLVLPLQTARGCPWGKCAFCSHHAIYGGSYRTWSVERIAELVRDCTIRYGCRHFAVVDEDVPPARALAIADMLEAEGMAGLSYYAYARLVKGCADPTVLSRLRRAGFTAFSWGMESGSQGVMDRMRKGTRVSCMEQVLNHTADSGISNQCFVMFGFPGETREDAMATVEFLERTARSIDGVSASVFDLEPTSPIGRQPHRWDVRVPEPGRYETLSGLSHHEAIVLLRRFQFESDMRLRTLTGDRLRYLPPDHLRRTMLFLVTSHGLMDTAAARVCLRSEADEAFPWCWVIFGKSRAPCCSP